MSWALAIATILLPFKSLIRSQSKKLIEKHSEKET